MNKLYEHIIAILYCCWLSAVSLILLLTSGKKFNGSNNYFRKMSTNFDEFLTAEGFGKTEILKVRSNLYSIFSVFML